MEDTDITTQYQEGKRPHLKKYQWPKGVSGNPAGRPKGSISPRDRIRQMFEKNPDDFDEFLQEYLNNPMNHRHVVELLDGKPHQSIDHTTLGKELPQPIINVSTNDSHKEGSSDEEEDSSSAGGNVSE
jgi:uncharacterized protein YeaO (DUF488 family)